MVEKSHTSGFWPSVYEPFRAQMAEWFAPASEAKVGDNGFTIRVEVPGVDEKDIKVSVEDGVVSVKGEKRAEREEKGDSWYFSERQYGSFSRSFRLPPEADPAAVRADLKEGVLVITVGKRAADAASGSEIPITKG